MSVIRLTLEGEPTHKGSGYYFIIDGDKVGISRGFTHADSAVSKAVYASPSGMRALATALNERADEIDGITTLEASPAVAQRFITVNVFVDGEKVEASTA